MILSIFIAFVFLTLIGYFWWEGHMGGWGKLSGEYPYREKEGIRATSYKHSIELTESGSGWNATNISASENGLIVEVGRWFRWARPSFCIPWVAVKNIEVVTSPLISRTRLDLKDTTESLEFSKKLFKPCKEMHERSTAGHSG